MQVIDPVIRYSNCLVNSSPILSWYFSSSKIGFIAKFKAINANGAIIAYDK